MAPNPMGSIGANLWKFESLVLEIRAALNVSVGPKYPAPDMLMQCLYCGGSDARKAAPGTLEGPDRMFICDGCFEVLSGPGETGAI